MASAESIKNQKPSKSEFDEAFDSLAAILFEQYKKKKLAEVSQDGKD